MARGQFYGCRSMGRITMKFPPYCECCAGLKSRDLLVVAFLSEDTMAAVLCRRCIANEINRYFDLGLIGKIVVMKYGAEGAEEMYMKANWELVST